ncbi:PAS domain-containing protein [Pseudoalteromonas fenneropenaei]|uniref:PAS domain-containing protein n=1 Tax=Pseudoalteromonas fenneropenaei TaxID=1737459 RepID=A0ABV7CPL4_9GAMM
MKKDEDKNLEELFFFSQLLQECSALELLKQILIFSHHAVVITDANQLNGYRIIYANPVFCRQTGYELAELVGNSPSILQGSDSNWPVIHRITPELRDKGYFHGSSVNYRKDGSKYAVEWSISEIRNELGDVSHYISFQRDLTQLHRMSDKIKKTNEVFKDFYLNMLHGKKAEAQPDLLELIKDNAKMYSGNIRQDDIPTSPTDRYFETSDQELGAFGRKVIKKAESAAFFWESNPIDEARVKTIIRALKAVENEIARIDLVGVTTRRLAAIADKLKEVANSVFFCRELNDGALIIDEVANSLRQEFNPSEFPIEVLLAFYKECAHWINDVFVQREAENIFLGETHVIAAGNQLLALLRHK